MFHQQVDGVSRTVHDGAHLLEGAVDERHAAPFQHLVALLQASLLGGAAGHRPHDVGEEPAVRGRLAAHDAHPEAACWKTIGTASVLEVHVSVQLCDASSVSGRIINRCFEFNRRYKSTVSVVSVIFVKLQETRRQSNGNARY